MKIGIVCPIGHLDRHGYQYVYRECLGSQVAFADKLYLVQSVRNRTGVDGLLKSHPNIKHIYGWFPLNDKGEEIFNIQRVVDNVNMGMAAAMIGGMDCIVCMDVNSYISEPEVLTGQCHEMLSTSSGWAWLYRKTQLANTMFHASTRSPNIIDCSGDYSFVADGLRTQDGVYISVVRGANWQAYESGAVVDVPLEMPLGDVAAKQNFIHCYHGLGSGAPSEVFSEAFFWCYSTRRIREMRISKEPLSPVGLSIAANNQPNFVSNEILRRIR